MLNLKSLNKPELLAEAIKMKANLENLDEEIINSRFDRLEKKIKASNDLLLQQDELIYQMEKQIYQLQQYNRRENIEIIGLPDNINNSELEKTVINILNKIGVSVTSFDIAACHRLKKKNGRRSANVIVRFVCRKKAIECLKNKKLLKSKVSEFKLFIIYLFIIENLCPNYQSAYNYCHKLKAEGKIDSLWTFNGIINFRKKDTTDDNIYKIFHYDEPHDHFNDEVKN